MHNIRCLFPVIYLIFFLPAVVGASAGFKAILFVTCLSLALVVNLKPTIRVAALLLTSLGTLVPFLLLVQAAVCATSMRSESLSCIAQRSLAVLLNVGLFSSVLWLAAASEWQGSLVTTVNRMSLPRSIRMMVVVAGAMIGEFRRAALKVHHAYTSRGEAVPSFNWRNLIVLPSMLGAVWASVLNGAVERIKGQWSSDAFWARYVPAERPPKAIISRSDLAVLGAGFLVIASLLEPYLF